MKHSIWYMRPEFFEYGVFGTLPNPANLSATHVHLTDVEANDLSDVYRLMRTDNWVRHGGDAHMLVINKGLDHVLMSVGDVIIDHRGNMHLVGPLGFGPAEAS
jgi:hypothetical protein